MSKMQRDKGNRRERELVKLLGAGAVRVPLSGAALGFKGDVLWEFGKHELILGTSDWDFCQYKLRIEVKAQAHGWKRLYAWLAPAHVDVLALRADDAEWLIVLPLDTLLALVKGEKDAGA